MGGTGAEAAVQRGEGTIRRCSTQESKPSSGDETVILMEGNVEAKGMSSKVKDVTGGSDKALTGTLPVCLIIVPSASEVGVKDPTPP